jgi:hypothetical protein
MRRFTQLDPDCQKSRSRIGVVKVDVLEVVREGTLRERSGAFEVERVAFFSGGEQYGATSSLFPRDSWVAHSSGAYLAPKTSGVVFIDLPNRYTH